MSECPVLHLYQCQQRMAVETISHHYWPNALLTELSSTASLGPGPEVLAHIVFYGSYSHYNLNCVCTCTVTETNGLPSHFTPRVIFSIHCNCFVF